jgi:P-type E1-E2 ATPase
LEAKGFWVLAVAVGPPAAMKLAGIIALSDPPRSDSAALITELRTLGVRTVMITGDAPATAGIVASTGTEFGQIVLESRKETHNILRIPAESR